MSIEIWPHIISMPVYFCFLIFIVEFSRRYLKPAVYFWAALLCTVPLWFLFGNIESVFRWVKYFSVIFVPLLICLTRLAVYEDKKGKFWRLLKNEKFCWVFYGFLFLNILEAGIQDIAYGNYFNAVTGFILCVTIPFAPKFWRMTKEKSYNVDLVAYTTFSWNLLYTLWNACFVYGEGNPAYVASSFTILLAAELYPRIKKRPELYFFARTMTITLHITLRATVDFFPTVMDSTTWYNPEVLHWWGIINFGLIIPYLFWYLWKLHTKNADIAFTGKVIPE